MMLQKNHRNSTDQSSLLRTIFSLVALLLFSMYLNGCNDSKSSTEVISGAGESMAGEMAGEVAGEEAGEMAGEMAGEVAGEVAGDEVNPISCMWHTDCPEQQCSNGICVGAGGECEFSQSCPLGEVCYEGRCVDPCLTDNECPAEGHCVNGSCVPYPVMRRGTREIVTQGSPSQLYIGVGIAPLRYPMGVSASGYGGRPGPQTPYNKSLGGSRSVIDRQDVRVVVIDSGEEVTLLVRLPLGWSTDYLRTLIAEEVGHLTSTDGADRGIDVLDHLLIFATHSHSQPGRFWNLVSSLPFGGFGFGSFSSSITKGYAQSTAKAIVAALEDREPGRIAWSVIDESDPEGRIHSNRRSTRPLEFDDRLLTLRFDRLDGTPKAGLIGYGIHGTHLMSPLLTGDAAAGIEQVITEQLSAKYNTYVPVLFANGNAANISPRGDHLTTNKLGHLQTIGELLWLVYEPIFDSLVTTADLPIKLRTKRFEIGYDQLGYGETDNGFVGSDGPYRYGAFQCVSSERRPEEDPHRGDSLGCLIDIQRVVHEPILQFSKTLVTALQIGNLVITTLPGEPSSGLGLRLAQAVEDVAIEQGIERPRSFNFGYAQDHQFYLLEPEDWYMGGYEASMSTWGPFMGRYLSEQALLNAVDLLSGSEPTYTALKPTWWPEVEDDTRLAPSVGPQSADMINEPNEKIFRGQLMKLTWIGGDPAVDLPKVTLMDAETDTVVKHPVSGLTFDDQGFESVMTYLGNYDDDQRWSIEWDLPVTLPVGQYWVRIEGQIGTDSSPYQLRSEVFELDGTHGLLIQDIRREGQIINAKLTYPNAPTNDDGMTEFEDLKATGSLLHLRGRGLDLSEPSGDLKSYRFIIGAPISEMVELHIWLIEEQALQGAEPDLTFNLSPSSSLCQTLLTTIITLFFITDQRIST